jgi:HTH-type transcriptional regulator/antitoxin HipB
MEQRLATSRQLGTLIASRRKALRLSQASLAERLGISQARVSELESRPETITVDRLLVILKALGMELSITDSVTPSNQRPASDW